MTNTCPKCGAEGWRIYGDATYDTVAYAGDFLTGIGVWCSDCKHWIIRPLSIDTLEDLIHELWLKGKIDEFGKLL